MADNTRIFDGVDDNITFAGGGVIGMTYGTIACVVKFDTTSTAFVPGGLLGVYTSTNTEVLAPKIYKTGGSSGFLSLMVDGVEKYITWPNPTTTTWRLVVIAKGTGTVIPKSWVYDFGTTSWVVDNADMDSSAANSARTVSKLNLGNELVDASFLKGAAAGGAIWKNRALTNTEVHSLVNHWDDWVTLTPDALLIANQASTGTSILDSIGTSNQSAITGTSVATGDSPMVELTVGSLEQEGFRWRNDDGSETTATWAAAQDTNLTAALGTQRLRALVNATSDPSAKAFTLRYKKSTDSVYQPVPTSAALTTAFGSLGAAPLATATSTIDIAYPTTVNVGDLLIVGIASRLGSTSIDAEGFSALANNTQNVATSEGTAGTEAADTGGVRVTVFYKIADGTETGTVTFANAGTATLSKNGRMLSFSKPFWATWDLADCNGKMASGATSWTAAMGTNPGIAIGDILVAVTALNTDAPTISAEAVTGTGLTSALTTEHVDVAGTGGNDTRLVITEHSVSAALTSGVPTVSFTASAGTPEGATVLTRIRATGSPPVIMQTSSNITGGGEATTAQLTAPSGKSTSDFVTGRMWDDENGVDSIDITTDDYTELEWCFKVQSPAAASDIYQFRVYAGSTPLNTYTVTPEWTVGSGTTTITGQVGLLTLAGVAGTMVPGLFTQAGQTGLMTLTALAGSMVRGITVLSSQTGLMTLTGLAGVMTPGAATHTGQIGTMTLAGQAGAMVPGSVTMPGQVGSMTLTAVPGALSGITTITGQTALMTLTALAGTMVPGLETHAGQIGLLNLTAIPGSMVRGITVLPSQTGQLSLAGVAGAMTPGAASIAGQTGLLTLLGLAGAMSPGLVTMPGQIGLMTLLGVSGSMTGIPPTTITGQTASMTLAGIAGSMIPGAGLIPGQTGLLLLTGLAGIMVPGSKTIPGQTATMSLLGIPGVLLQSQNMVGQTALLNLTAVSGSMITGAATILGQTGLMSLTAQPGTMIGGLAVIQGQVGLLFLTGVSGHIIIGIFKPLSPLTTRRWDPQRLSGRYDEQRLTRSWP